MGYDFCFLISEYTGGGTARIITDIADGLAEKGKKVAFISLYAVDKYNLGFNKAVDAIHLDNQSFIGGVLSLKKWIHSNNPKAVIACDKSVAKKVITATRILSSFQGKVIALQSQRIFKASIENEPVEDDLGIHILAWLYKKADLIIAKSFTIEEELRKILPKEKIKLIQTPVNLESIKKLANEEIPHSWLSFKIMPVIVSMGRMIPEKGYETLLRAFALASARRPMRLILLGDGYYKDYLEKLVKNLKIEDSVSFQGFVKNPYSYLKNADLFVSASEHEGFFLAAAEAMACGCNIVATECCKEPTEMLRHGELGSIVPPSSTAQLEKAILYRLAHPVAPSVLQEQVLQYDISSIVKDYESLIG